MKRKNTESLVDKTANQIVDFITKNKLKPRDKIPTEIELMEMLSVSRSTIREAVKLLVSRNILESRQGAGTFLSTKKGIPNDPLGISLLKYDSSLVLELVEARLMFEPEIAALAAVNATKNQISTMKDICSKIESLINQDKIYYQEDILLHHAIAAGSGNRVIEHLVPILHSSIRQSILATEDSLKKETIIYHRRCIEAIELHDFQSARLAMLMHLNINREYLLSNKIKHPNISKITTSPSND